jgi:hypothetical protein
MIGARRALSLRVGALFLQLSIYPADVNFASKFRLICDESAPGFPIPPLGGERLSHIGL